MAEVEGPAAGASGHSIGGVKLPPPDQIGIVVRDVDSAVEFYSSTFGLGPFKIHLVEDVGFTLHGEEGRAKLKLAMAQMGQLEIELIEVLEGETIHSEFLREKGEGIQHIRFRIRDIDAMIAELAKSGVEPVYYHMCPDANGYAIAFAYMSSEKMGDVMVELIEEMMSMRRRAYNVIIRTSAWFRLRRICENKRR